MKCILTKKMFVELTITTKKLDKWNLPKYLVNKNIFRR